MHCACSGVSQDLAVAVPAAMHTVMDLSEYRIMEALVANSLPGVPRSIGCMKTNTSWMAVCFDRRSRAYPDSQDGCGLSSVGGVYISEILCQRGSLPLLTDSGQDCLVAVRRCTCNC